MNKTKSNGVMHRSIDFKKRYWEEPKELGYILTSLMNSILNDVDFHSRQEEPRYVFTKFEELKSLVGDPDNSDRLNFVFECYDVADKDEEAVFVSKLNDEDREAYELNKSS